MWWADLASSANSSKSEDESEVGKLLMKTKNRSGPNVLRCRMPEITGSGLETLATVYILKHTEVDLSNRL